MSIIKKLGITEGPWEVRESGGDRTKEICTIGNVKIFSIHTPKDACYPDAKLITASPEMLEALILNVLNEELLPEKWADDSAFLDGKAAIEKATNKTWTEIKELINE